eukprot:scaffold7381_cov310-Pinguiococcus_pyrenoidosus.AAC.60
MKAPIRAPKVGNPRGNGSPSKCTPHGHIRHWGYHRRPCGNFHFRKLTIPPDLAALMSSLLPAAAVNLGLSLLRIVVDHVGKILHGLLLVLGVAPLVVRRKRSWSSQDEQTEGRVFLSILLTTHGPTCIFPGGLAVDQQFLAPGVQAGNALSLELQRIRTFERNAPKVGDESRLRRRRRQERAAESASKHTRADLPPRQLRARAQRRAEGHCAAAECENYQQRLCDLQKRAAV